MVPRFALVLAASLAACTDPLAGAWQSHGPDAVGDFEIFISDTLTGRVKIALRSPSGELEQFDEAIEAELSERDDGVWTYDVSAGAAGRLQCDLARKTDELTCRWRKHDLDFVPFEEDDARCDHSVCTVGGPLRAGCDLCTSIVCDLDKFCCSGAWDEHCVRQADFGCDATHCGL